MKHSLANIGHYAVNGLVLAGRHVAEITLYALILLISIDVFGRYVLSRPTNIADELGGYMLVVIAYWGAPYALQKGAHVKVTFVVEHLSLRIRKTLELVMDAIGFIFVIVLTWQSANLVIISFQSGTRSASIMRTPMFVPELAVPVGLAVFCFEILRQLIAKSKGLSVR